MIFIYLNPLKKTPFLLHLTFTYMIVLNFSHKLKIKYFNNFIFFISFILILDNKLKSIPIQYLLNFTDNIEINTYMK